MTNNQFFRYNETLKELDDLKSSVRNIESYIKRQAKSIFSDLVDNKFKTDSIIEIRNSNFVYRIVDVDLLETDEKGLMPYVYIVRVSKKDYSKLASQSKGIDLKIISEFKSAFNITNVIKY